RGLGLRRLALADLAEWLDLEAGDVQPRPLRAIAASPATQLDPALDVAAVALVQPLHGALGGILEAGDIDPLHRFALAYGHPEAAPGVAVGARAGFRVYGKPSLECAFDALHVHPPFTVAAAPTVTVGVTVFVTDRRGSVTSRHG